MGTGFGSAPSKSVQPKMASEAVTQLREDGFNFHELYGYGISDKLNYAQDI